MNPRSPVDLHLHSSASDGVLEPAALVAHAAACGVRLLALTDHDTVAGLDEAGAAARRLGVTLVTGVELSVDWRGRSLHLLGLAFDPLAASLVSGLRLLQEQRLERAEQMASRLTTAGAPGKAALELVRAAGRLPTRMHFARALVALGTAADAATAFDRWLARGRPGYYAAKWPSLDEATGWVVAAGGAAVIAHPMRYPLSAGARRELCAEFVTAGGRGIEVITGGGGIRNADQAISLAIRCGLEGSVGSDFHDPAIPWNPPGRLAKLPGSVRPVWFGPPFPAFETDAEPA
jgi:predicted metal-dependent phosphoesterase TrpH